MLYNAVVKDVVFMGGADEDLRSFPPSARQRAGYQLYLVQTGADPTDWKLMTTIGPGCREIRVRDDAGAFRLFYVATIGDAVYVLHCFQKKTQRTESRHRRRQSPLPGHASPHRGDEEAMTTAKRYQSVWDAVEGYPIEAENFKIRAALMAELAAYIERAGLTQTQAARRFGVTQPRISDLVRGKIDLFSIDTLVNMLTAAGLHLDLAVRPAQAS
jgi:phage-related protein/predicted XRE-type DNA-binding protein